jgi:hypothetical protein
MGKMLERKIIPAIRPAIGTGTHGAKLVAVLGYFNIKALRPLNKRLSKNLW